MTNPEDAWKKEFEPLSSLHVEVDQPTKDRILRAVQASATKSTWWDKAREQFAWAFHPLPAIATLALVLMGGITWSQLGGRFTPNDNNNNTLLTERTIMLKQSGSDLAQSGAAEAMTLSGRTQSGGASLDMMIAPDPNADLINNRYVFQFSGSDRDLDLKADEMIYRVSYLSPNADQKQAIATSLGFSDGEQNDNCQEIALYDAADVTSSCYPETLYKNGNNSLSFSGENPVYLYYTTERYDEGYDPWADAAKNYDQLPNSLNLGDVPTILMQYLKDNQLVASEIADQLVVLPTKQIQYACPGDLYAQYDYAVVSSAEAEQNMQSGCYQQVTYSEEDSNRTDYKPQEPQRTEFSPKPFRQVFVATLKELGSDGESYPLYDFTIDHTGAIVEFSGRIPSQIESLPTASASVRTMIDALNAGTVEAPPAMGLLYQTGSLMREANKDISNEAKITLTHQVTLKSAKTLVTVYQGEDGSDYYVPSYSLSGTIVHDQIPEEKAARRDGELQAQCKALEDELYGLYESMDNAVKDDVVIAPAEEEGSKLIDPAFDVTVTSEGESSSPGSAGDVFEPGSAGSEEPLPALSANEQRISDIATQRDTMRCYVFDYDPTEPTDYETQIPAFPGLSLIMDGGAK